MPDEHHDLTVSRANTFPIICQADLIVLALGHLNLSTFLCQSTLELIDSGKPKFAHVRRTQLQLEVMSGQMS